MVDISKYTSDFHNGSITDITQRGAHLMLTMRSAEVDPDDIEEDLVLGKHDRIQGILHLEDVAGIIENKINNLQLNYDSGGIFDLDICDQKVILNIAWTNYPPKDRTPVARYYAQLQLQRPPMKRVKRSRTTLFSKLLTMYMLQIEICPEIKMENLFLIWRMQHIHR